MEQLQVIRTESECELALCALEKLMDSDPAPGTPGHKTMEVLAVLIEKYESEHVELGKPDPIEAIRFRMDQQNLGNKDLAPYIGSAGKVSEVLSGKRSLSLNMIRNLHRGLGISYDALLSEPQIATEELGIDWLKFPLKEMMGRGLLRANKLAEVKERAEEEIRAFFGPRLQSASAVYHKKSPIRSGRSINTCALAVWHTLALKEADSIPLDYKFDLSSMNDEFFEDLVKLSNYAEGPLLAKEFLAKHGIRLVIVEHFTKTYLDGAALKLENGDPVVCLTLRHDRLDNFWYVLLHELVHIEKHLYSDDHDAIFDDLDVNAIDEIEDEADKLAFARLVPGGAEAVIKKARKSKEVILAAHKYNRHPAIFAGRLRNDRSNYRIFNGLIGRREVKKLFQ